MSHLKLISMKLEEAVADLDLQSFISKVPHHIPVIDVKNWDREGSLWRSMYSGLLRGEWLKVNRMLKQTESDLLDEPRDGELQNAILLGSYFGHFDLVHKVITSLRDVLRLAIIETAKTKGGFTALHLASMGICPDPPPEGLTPQHSKVVKLLLEDSNCNTEILTSKTPKGDWTALHLAAGNGQLDSLRALVAAYECAAPASGGKDEIAFVLRDTYGMTPLHLAALESHEEVVRELLRWEMTDVNALNNLALTALHLASMRGHTKIVEHLVKVPEVDVNAADCCLSTSLHWAAHAGASDVVRCFVAASKHRTIRMAGEDLEGSTVLQVTAGDCSIHNDDIHTILLESNEVKELMERLYRDRQVFVDAANAMLVGATLISSVTFGGWLQPPLGYVNYSQFSADYAAVEQHLTVRMFWIFNSLSFYFAMATAILAAGCILPTNTTNIKRSVRRIRQTVNCTSFLLVLSIIFVLAAFTVAGFAGLPPIQEYQRNMKITTLIGLVVCVLVLFYLGKITHFRVRRDLKLAGQYLMKKFVLVKERMNHRLEKESQSREHHIFAKMAELPKISDPDKLAMQKDEIIDRLQLFLYLRDLPTRWYRTKAEKAMVDSLFAFRDAGVLEVDGSSGQLCHRPHHDSYRVQDVNSLYWSFKANEQRRFNTCRRRRNPFILYDSTGELSSLSTSSSSLRYSFKNR